MVKTNTKDKDTKVNKNSAFRHVEKESKLDKAYHIVGVVFNLILLLFIVLETINLYMNYRFLPVLVVLVLSAAYLGINLVKTLWVKFKIKLKERKELKVKPDSKAKQLVNREEIKEEVKEESRGWVVFDIVVKYIKLTGKTVIGLFIFWMLFDSVNINGKLQVIEESTQVNGIVLECTDIVLDGVCVVETPEGLSSVVFTDSGDIMKIVEGNVLKRDTKDE